MRFAHVDGERREAEPGLAGTCPRLCGCRRGALRGDQGPALAAQIEPPL